MYCYKQLERWADAVRDYEVLRRELPDDSEVAESLFHAQVALKKSRGEEVYNMKFGGEVEEVLGFEQFRAAISLPGKSLLNFKHSMFHSFFMLQTYKTEVLCDRCVGSSFQISL